MKIILKEGNSIALKKLADYAIVAITKNGVELARILHKELSASDLFYMSKFEKGDEEQLHITLFSGSVRLLLPSLFQTYKGIIFLISLGAIVRMIAPLIKDKKTDPAVVVIDESGEYVISVLSGHLGGANELTQEVAEILRARPVITTASDVQKTISVDLFGRHLGWEWETGEKLTSVSASVVNEEHVAIIQESGERNWWNYGFPLPKAIKLYPTINDALLKKPEAALVITHRILQKREQAILENGILYRPKVIVLGIGCNRGTEMDEIEQLIEQTLAELQFSIKSIKAICSIDLKANEKGLLAITEKYNWEFVCYSAEQLNRVPIEKPSETVFKYTGAYGVSEPAARLYSGTEKLSLIKKKSGNVTISVAVIPF